MKTDHEIYLENQLKEMLEHAINEIGLAEVVILTQSVCHKKADLARNDWREHPTTARNWVKVAGMLDRVADRIMQIEL